MVLVFQSWELSNYNNSNEQLTMRHDNDLKEMYYLTDMCQFKWMNAKNN